MVLHLQVCGASGDDGAPGFWQSGRSEMGYLKLLTFFLRNAEDQKQLPLCLGLIGI